MVVGGSTQTASPACVLGQHRPAATVHDGAGVAADDVVPRTGWERILAMCRPMPSKGSLLLGPRAEAVRLIS